MTIKNLKWTSRSLPQELRRAARELDHIVCRLAPGGWIAGGALRSRIAKDGASDYDCYFSHPTHFNLARENLLTDRELSVRIKFEDITVLTLDSTIGKIDLVKRFYKTPIHCLEDFDFTVCQFAIDSHHRVYWSSQGLSDLHDRKLVLANPSCPLSTMMRLNKYGAKGYQMDVNDHIKLARMIKDKDFIATEDRMLKRQTAYPIKSLVSFADKSFAEMITEKVTEALKNKNEDYRDLL